MDDPQNVNTYKFGGIDDKNLAFLLQVKTLFNYYGGNIDSLGGLGPQTGTVGQDKLIAESASRRLADFRINQDICQICLLCGVALYLPR